MNDQTVTSIAALADEAIAAAQKLWRPPESTYRLQLHETFTFKDAIAIVPYLAQLGITHVYTSSYLRAVPGSTHGYDVIDHTRLNPEIGSDEDFAAFNAALKSHGLTHILDTVPNHVGVATNENRWWNDVLENGPAAAHANYFDIAWRPAARPELTDKILLPGLGNSYGAALAGGDFKIKFEPATGSLYVQVYERRFPITPRSYSAVLALAISSIAEAGDAKSLGEILKFADESSAEDSGAVKGRLAELCRKSPSAGKAIASAADAFAGAAGDEVGADRLHALLEQQHYRLASWRVGPEEINYRRFFAINDLAALAMERAEVFEAAHSFILPRLGDGTIAGLRIDHPDGLADPLQYFQRLQTHFLLACAKAKFAGDAATWQAVRQPLLEELERRLGDLHGSHWPLYVVIEKILALGETMPATWPVDGTSGYDFLDMVNGLFVNRCAADAMTDTYREFIGEQPTYEELVFQNKKMILRQLLPSELSRLAARLDRIAQRNRMTRDFTTSGIASALSDVIAAFPLYRTYITGPDISEADRAALRTAIDAAIARNPTLPRDIFDFIEATLLQKSFRGATDEDRGAALKFAEKFQQLTAPTTAKGIEDTTFYQYQRVISLNEVGGEPSKFGISPNELHAYFADRQTRWPYALSTLSTHDTKRSEDVRARISVLADVPDEWRAVVSEWSDINTPLRRETAGLPSPARDEEYCYYQTLLGAWPTECEGTPANAAFIERVQAFLLKANREANVRTAWTTPNEQHEAAVKAFVAGTLDPKQSQAFHASFLPFQKKIAHFGRLASLGQTVIKLTAPGAADTYQGTEMWDLSLVDPDNRRPVDYKHRQAALAAVGAANADPLFANLADGRAKLFLHLRMLKLRKEFPGLFTRGEYVPLKVDGRFAEHVFAFKRSLNGKSAIVAVALNLAKLARFDPSLPLDANVWSDTRLNVSASGRWRDVLGGGDAELADNVAIADLLRGRPVGVWITA